MDESREPRAESRELLILDLLDKIKAVIHKLSIRNSKLGARSSKSRSAD